MDDYVRKSLNGYILGDISQQLIDQCKSKHGFLSEEETLIFYLKKSLDMTEDADLEECIREAKKLVSFCWGLENDISGLMSLVMYKDIRPSNEICKNCDRYINQFCSYELCRVNPFEKGCEGWSARITSDKVVPIGKSPF